MSETAIGIIGLLVLIVVFLSGLELAFCMAIIGFLGYSLLVSVQAGFGMVAQDIFDTLSTYGFTVVPVFILMG